MPVTNAISRFISRLFSNKRFNIAFSLIFAFIFWIVISVKQSPTRERTFTDVSLAVSIENTVVANQGLSIISDITTPKFSVTVSGPNYLVSALKKDDFSLSVDLTEVTEAKTYTFAVKAKPNENTSTGYEFVSVSPAKVRITFDYIEDKEYLTADQSLRAGAEYKLADGFMIKPDFKKNPADYLTDTDDFKNVSSVSLHGPRSTLKMIDYIKAYTHSNDKLNKTDYYNADLLLYSPKGKLLYTCISNGDSYDIYSGKYASDAEAIDPTKLAVVSTKCLKLQIPLLKNKVLKISALVDGNDELQVKTDPASIVVRGDPAVIDGLGKDVTAILKIPPKQLDKVFKFSDLILPERVELAGKNAEREITVSVQERSK